MARLTRVVPTSLGVYEDTAPPRNLRYRSAEENLETGLGLLEIAGKFHPDLVLLPESFTAAGAQAGRIRDVAQPIPGPSFDAVADRARKFSTYVLAGFYQRLGDAILNVGALIDREGQLVGTYVKQHPTPGEIDQGVVPGNADGVFETDFGRIGVAICFDLNWSHIWQAFSDRGVDLACWISAYQGGFPLRAHAALHGYPIITSIWPFPAQVIGRTGAVVAETSQWNPVLGLELDLGSRLFHTDGQIDKIVEIERAYGSRLRVQAMSDEHMFTVEAADSTLSVDDVAEDFGLVGYREFIRRCEARQDEARGAYADLTVREADK